MVRDVEGSCHGLILINSLTFAWGIHEIQEMYQDDR
jgi:hypothetical protein